MSKNARLKIALTRTIVNFFVNEDLCADEISIQGTLCITADKSTIFVTQIAETIVDPNSRSVLDHGSGGGGSDHYSGSRGNRRETSNIRHSFDGRGGSRGGGGDSLALGSGSSTGGKRASQSDTGEGPGSQQQQPANWALHPLVHLQSVEPARSVPDGSGRPSPLDRLHAVAQAQAAAAAVLPERHGSGSTLPSDKPVALTTHHHSQEDVLLSPPTSIADFTALYQSIANKIHAAKFGAGSSSSGAHVARQPHSHPPTASSARSAIVTAAEDGDKDVAPSSAKKSRVDSVESPDQPPVTPPMFRDFRHFSRGPSMASAYSHLFPSARAFDLTRNNTADHAKSDNSAKDLHSSEASTSASAPNSSAALPDSHKVPPLVLKQEESDSEEASASPASRTHSLCSPTTSHAPPPDLINLPSPHSRAGAAAVLDKHRALSPGALGGSLPPMHMLQERLGSVALPPLQMPALSASWPPIGGMISPGLSSPDARGGSDAWIRKPRTKFSPDQLQALELEYQMDPFLSTSADKRADLAKKLSITEKNVQIWFQNQRRRRRAAAYSKMHYVFSGDHAPGAGVSYPPTMPGEFASSSANGEPLDDELDDEDDMEAGHAPDLLELPANKDGEQHLTNRNGGTERPTGRDGEASRGEGRVSRSGSVQGKKGRESPSENERDAEPRRKSKAFPAHNSAERDSGARAAENNCLAEIEDGHVNEAEGDTANEVKHTDGIQGKLSNQSRAVHPLLAQNSVDTNSDEASPSGADVAVDQS